MKKLAISLLFILCFLHGNTQNWKTCRFDDLLSFKLPQNYVETDTLEQKLFSATGDFGVLLVNKIPDSNAMDFSVSNEDQLESLYLIFQREVLKTANGTLHSSKSRELNNIKAKYFIFESLGEDQTLIQHTLLIFLNNALYSFNFWYDQEIEEKAMKERDRFFASLNLSEDLKFENQLTESDDYSGSVKAAENFGAIMSWSSIPILLVLFVLWKKNKYKTVIRIKNAIAIFFVCLGLANFILFLGNWFFDADNTVILSLLRMSFFLVFFGSMSFNLTVPGQKSAEGTENNPAYSDEEQYPGN